MKDTVSTPTFLNGRDGILAADQADNSSANRCLIWEVFAIRGMGVSASSSSDQSTVTPATDVPSNCLSHFTYNGATSGHYNDAATLSTVLTDAVGLPIANQPVTLATAGQNCSATTDSSGAASCQVTPVVDPWLLHDHADLRRRTGLQRCDRYVADVHRHQGRESARQPGDADRALPRPGNRVCATRRSRQRGGRRVDGTGHRRQAGHVHARRHRHLQRYDDGSGNVVLSADPARDRRPASRRDLRAEDTDYSGTSKTDTFSVTPEETTMTYAGPTVILAGSSGVTSRPGRRRAATTTTATPARPRQTQSRPSLSPLAARAAPARTDPITGNVQCTIPSISVPLGPETVGASFAGRSLLPALERQQERDRLRLPQHRRLHIG